MADATGFSVVIIIISAISAVLIAAVTLYLMAAFLHPEDRMQAWFPKIVVALSIFLAIATVLMFPLDVANARACDNRILFTDCDLTLPMEELWFAVYIINIVLVYLVTPFALFYYEADSELTLGKRLRSALVYTLLAVLVFGLILVLIYTINGNVEYRTTLLQSGLEGVQSLQSAPADSRGCLLPAGENQEALCSAFAPNVRNEIFRERPSFPIYIVAAASVVGWILFMVMGGVGLIALPLDLILSWFDRPKKSITRTQYNAEAKLIALRAVEIQAEAKALRNEENANGRSRKWRGKTKALGKVLNRLEDDERELEKQFPQGEDRDSKWVLYVLSFWVSLLVGIVFAIVAITWVLHMVIYIIPSPPFHPFLNNMFIALDDAFSFFGIVAFAIWCFFLILAAIKGFMKLGLNFGVIRLYPMKLGATMMSSFLVNSALILLVSAAVVQFCATSFDGYARNTSIQEIFGSEVFNLQSVRPLFEKNVFVIVLLVVAALTAVWTVVRGPAKRRKGPLTLAEAYAEG